ncbi:hypothetical protein KPG66_12360 [Mycetohabitans sp. B2]|uniref:hypothetical protein n=1 Tax=Mycetohabitans sp. B2 TaxID=2841274 RepID=UPI001F324F55|nr:hypothetical protein [Mycetohabitans sp. B2]MCF7696855.1 hypothetical protein [Mycetohabitans sp. B2]
MDFSFNACCPLLAWMFLEGNGRVQTMLRLLKGHGDEPCAATPQPHIMGIVDGLFKRGSCYATLLTDLQKRRLLDLLPPRGATTAANWLSRHCAVQFVSRGRAGAYAEGISRGDSHGHAKSRVEPMLAYGTNFTQSVEKSFSACC